MKRNTIIIASIGTLILGYYFWLMLLSGDFFYTYSRNAPNRAALLKIHEEIQLGDNYENVLKIYWQHESSDLRLFAENPKTWVIQTPSELTSGNWVMYIEFAEDKASAVKIKTSDGPSPSDAPQDKTIEKTP